MTKRLLLVNPVNKLRPGLSANPSSRFQPLGLGMVAALTPEDWQITLIDENWDSFKYVPADLVGITAFTSSANRAYEIAAIYRDEGIPVVMGGIHASLAPEEALEHVDSVVIGEAEPVWEQVLEDAHRGMLQRTYHGERAGLAGLPFPRRDLFRREYPLVSVQTARGCPMDCDFCSVTAFNGHLYRRRPIDEVLAELKSIPQKGLFFVDDNIVGYGKRARDEALALFKGMAQMKLNKNWWCQASVNIAQDEELLHWASMAGCRMIFLGLEAEATDALQSVNKQLNKSIIASGYEKLFATIHSNGIAVLGAFIFGLDTDTQDTVADRTRFVLESGADAVQVTLLTPLPGTRLFSRLRAENRLARTRFPSDWDRYDFTEVVYRPLHISERQLASAFERCRSALYSRASLVERARSTLSTTKSLAAALYALQANIDYKVIAECQQSRLHPSNWQTLVAQGHSILADNIGDLRRLSRALVSGRDVILGQPTV